MDHSECDSTKVALSSDRCCNYDEQMYSYWERDNGPMNLKRIYFKKAFPCCREFAMTVISVSHFFPPSTARSTGIVNIRHIHTALPYGGNHSMMDSIISYGQGDQVILKGKAVIYPTISDS